MSRWVRATRRSSAPRSASARCGIRAARRAGQRHADHAHPYPAPLPHERRLGATPRPPCGSVEDVGAEPREARLLHALAEHGGTKVELVIAEYGRIEAKGVPHLDHLAALEERGEQRGRQRVAGEDEQRLWRPGAQFADQGGDAGKTAAAVHGPELIDVVHEQELDADGRARLAGRGGTTGQRDEGEEETRRAKAQRRRISGDTG